MLRTCDAVFDNEIKHLKQTLSYRWIILNIKFARMNGEHTWQDTVDGEE